MKNNPTAQSIHRESQALALIACMAPAEGLQHPKAQSLLEELPKEVAIEIFHLAIISRGNLEGLFASSTILNNYIHEPNPEDVLEGIPLECFDEDEAKCAA